MYRLVLVVNGRSARVSRLDFASSQLSFQWIAVYGHIWVTLPRTKKGRTPGEDTSWPFNVQNKKNFPFAGKMSSELFLQCRQWFLQTRSFKLIFISSRLIRYLLFRACLSFIVSLSRSSSHCEPLFSARYEPVSLFLSLWACPFLSHREHVSLFLSSSAFLSFPLIVTLSLFFSSWACLSLIVGLSLPLIVSLFPFPPIVSLSLFFPVIVSLSLFSLNVNLSLSLPLIVSLFHFSCFESLFRFSSHYES